MLARITRFRLGQRVIDAKDGGELSGAQSLRSLRGAQVGLGLGDPRKAFGIFKVCDFRAQHLDRAALLGVFHVEPLQFLARFLDGRLGAVAPDGGGREQDTQENR